MNYQSTLLADPTENYSCVSLHKCVNRAMVDLDGFKITNDVYQALFVSTDKDILIETLDILLNSIIFNNPGCTIQLTAKPVGNITLVHIKSNDATDFTAINKKMPKLESLAGTIGGCVTISTNDRYGLAVGFTFMNH